MPRKKKAPAGASKKKAAGHGEPPGKAKRKAKAAPAEPKPRLDLRTSVDQIGIILHKVLELADSGVALGVNVVSLLRSVTQGRVVDAKATGEEAYFSGSRAAVSQEEPAGFPGPQPESAATGEQAQPRRYCVVNRAPVAPGGAVRASFSINNDLPQGTRKLSVSARDFVGAVHGYRLEDGVLSVDPPSARVKPLDFEKFVLQGRIPTEAPEDSYNGWIAVEGDETIKIPALLLVSKHG